jgi:hypothetical protein
MLTLMLQRKCRRHADLLAHLYKGPSAGDFGRSHWSWGDSCPRSTSIYKTVVHELAVIVERAGLPSASVALEKRRISNQ